MKPQTLKWNLDALSEALHLSKDDTVNYFTDGRRVSFIMERRLALEILNGSIAQNEGAGWDVMDGNGKRWEVRSISKGGVYFSPSYMVGSGRKFQEEGFLKKLNEIEGYIVSDITLFPKIPFWQISCEQIRLWWSSGELGKNSKISRRKALSLISEIHPS